MTLLWYTLVLSEKKSHSDAECNFQVPYHFGIFKVYRFHKISGQKLSKEGRGTCLLLHVDIQEHITMKSPNKYENNVLHFSQEGLAGLFSSLNF